MARIKLAIPDEFIPEIDEARKRIDAGRLMQINGAYLESSGIEDLWDKVREIFQDIPLGAEMTFDHETRTVSYDAEIEEGE